MYFWTLSWNRKRPFCGARTMFPRRAWSFSALVLIPRNRASSPDEIETGISGAFFATSDAQRQGEVAHDPVCEILVHVPLDGL